MAEHKILVSDGLSEEGLRILGVSAEVTNNPKIAPEELLVAIPLYDALVVRSRTKVNSGVLNAGTNLKVVGRAGVGVDNIDIPTAVAGGIVVVNSPLAASSAVAELTIGLMFAMARNITRADASLKQNQWEKKTLMGVELGGKILGLLGIGRIGTETARRACALDMKVIACDPALEEDQVRRRFAEPVTMDELLAGSDYLSIHLPLTEGTLGLMGAEQFSRMKRGARIICTARGKIIDEDALRNALDDGHLEGAALDVFASEPPLLNGIATHPKVVATPHIGAQTREAQARAGIDIAEEVIAALQGKLLRWQVTA